MANPNKKNNPSSLLGRAVFLAAALVLMVYMLMILSNSTEFFAESAKKNALSGFERDLLTVEQLSTAPYGNLYDIADRLEYATSSEEVNATLSGYIGSEQFGNLHYFSQEHIYSVSGIPLDDTYSSDDALVTLGKSNVRSCTDIFRDSRSGYDCIAFFVPVRGSTFVDGVLSIVPARNVITLQSVLGEETSAALLVAKDGVILTAAHAPNFEASIGNDFGDFLSRLTVNKTQVNPLLAAMQENVTSSGTLSTAGREYTVVLAPVKNLDSRYFLVTLADNEHLLGAETEYIRHVVILILFSMAFLIAVLLYVPLSGRKKEQTVSSSGSMDPLVGCPDLEHFRKAGEEFLRQRAHGYAVCIFELRQFRQISETLTQAELMEMLRHIAKVLETFCGPKETFGYMGDGRFVHLLSYSGEASVRSKVRLVEGIANKHAVLGQNKSSKKFNIGVSVAPNSNRSTVDTLIGQASIACDKAKANGNVPYEVYTESINAELARNNRIEAEMESALTNGEFRLFLQPKYNVAEDRLDSAEALVRWFDPRTGDYRFPGEFIGLFETNGFIVKLDHFMYLEVLKNLSNAVQRQERVVPISINVSHVTVNTPGFLDFYIQNKRKYQVPDGFLTIEFSEGIAMEDVDQVRQIVTQLHKNGIQCSIDNFGTGYGSLVALKNIPLDEVKIARMFLKRGYQDSTDKTIMTSMVALSKSLGIRVVQEGVETKEMFDASIARGCDIIQGYYYAKAITAEEYRLFINSNTSIRYKAQVK